MRDFTLAINSLVEELQEKGDCQAFQESRAAFLAAYESHIERYIQPLAIMRRLGIVFDVNGDEMATVGDSLKDISVKLDVLLGLSREITKGLAL